MRFFAALRMTVISRYQTIIYKKGATMNLNDEREELRRTFRPNPVRLLLIGESPSARGRFFYAANSNLFRYTREAFAAAFGPCIASGDSFLLQFVALGCFLDDLWLEPIGHLPAPERRLMRQRGVAPLAQRLAEMQPSAIVVVMRSLEPFVQRAIVHAHLATPLLASVVFPAQSHQRRYVHELAAVLRWLQAEHVLAVPAALNTAE